MKNIHKIKTKFQIPLEVQKGIASFCTYAYLPEGNLIKVKNGKYYFKGNGTFTNLLRSDQLIQWAQLYPMPDGSFREEMVIYE